MARLLALLATLGVPTLAAAAGPVRSGTGRTEAGAAAISALEQRIARLEAQLSARSLAAHRLPEEVSLLGKRIPLHLSDVRERLEREFYVAMGDRATLVLWQKRAGKAFPTIERVLRRRELPDDLKYVAVIESGLRNHAKSWAGAVGPWQFMPATGREQGLRVRKVVDDRRDLERSTEAALDYLTSLRRRFGDWHLALAAYNCGPGRVRRALRAQGVSSYWDLVLPNEAERYVSRVAAVRLILTDPKRFGIHVPDAERFSAEPTRRVQVALKSPLSVVAVARAAGTTYRHIRRLNPWLRSAELPKGTHRLTVPTDVGSGFAARIAALSPAASAKAGKAGKGGGRKKARPARRTVKSKKARKPKKPKRLRHRVRKGESLWDVAQRYGMTVADLQRKNRIRRPDRIYPGQMLRIR